MGDFRLSGDDLYPSTQKGLNNFGWGGGAESPLKHLHPHLFLEVSFISYVTLSPVPHKYAFTQYILGIDYKFGRV